MKIQVDTLIRKDERFIPFAGQPDPTGGDRSKSCDGAVVLSIEGRPVLTTREWDELDGLWAFLLMGMVRSMQWLPFECTFPDQPLRLAMTPVGEDRTLIEVGRPRDENYKRGEAPTEALAAALADAGSRFLDWLEGLGREESASRRYVAFLRGELTVPPRTWTRTQAGTEWSAPAA